MAREHVTNQRGDATMDKMAVLKTSYMIQWTLFSKQYTCF